MVWGYIKSRETARRMKAYAGEVTSLHPHFAFDSPARAMDMDLATTNAYALPGNISAGIQHGTWSQQIEPGKPPQPNLLNSNQQHVREPLKYTREDIAHIEKWGKWLFDPAVTRAGTDLPLQSNATPKQPGTPSAHVPWAPRKATRS
jgi:alcohol oxidase